MRRLKTFITLALAVAFAGCTPEENPAGNTDFDVRLDIPAEIVLEADAKSVEFTVVDGKAPKSSDIMILNGSAGQKFCNLAQFNIGLLIYMGSRIIVQFFTGCQHCHRQDCSKKIMSDLFHNTTVNISCCKVPKSYPRNKKVRG